MRTTITMATLVFILLWGLVASQTIDQIFQQGMELFEQGNYAEAKDKFITVLEEPTNSHRGEAYVHLLKCYLFLKEHDSLEQAFGQYQAEFAGTEHEAQARIARSESLRDNKAEYQTAIDEFTVVTQNFTDTEHAAEAYFGIVKSAKSLRDIEQMDEAFNALKAKHPGSRFLGASQFHFGELYLKELDNRGQALKAYMKATTDYPNAYSRPIAMLRAADLVPKGKLTESIVLYNQVLAEYPDDNYACRWANMELGICYFIKEDPEQAKPYFEKVMQMTQNQKYVEKAQRYLNAIDNPESVDAFRCHYDAATRLLRDCKEMVLSLLRYGKCQGLAEKPPFQQYLADSSIPVEDRAQREYEVCHALFQWNKREQSYELAQSILERYPESTFTKYECLYMMAFIDGEASNFDRALQYYAQILDERPEIKFAPSVLKEIAWCHFHSGELLNALLIIDHLRELYPHSRDTRQAMFTHNQILANYPEVRDTYVAFKERTQVRNGRVIVQQPQKDEKEALISQIINE